MHRIQLLKETKTTIRKENCRISRRELISSLILIIATQRRSQALLSAVLWQFTESE